MRFQAVSIGYAVPRTDFDAVVHSVFDSAINLMPAGQELLITVLTSGNGDLPQGIRLEVAEAPFRQVMPGAPSRYRRGLLSIGGAMTIDLTDARPWDFDLASLDADVSDAAVRSVWRCAWDALNGRQVSGGAGIVAADFCTDTIPKPPTWAEHLHGAMRALLAATAQCDAVIRPLAGALIGLGPGLTPSGDDLLVGFLAGLWCHIAGRRERRHFLEALGEAVIDLSQQTNDISRTYLVHAAKGHVSSRLVELATAICLPKADADVLKCLKAAAEVGHTSGMDAVTGLLLGLAAWDTVLAPDLSAASGSRR